MLSPALAVWTVGGLETLPAALALTAGVLALCVRAPGRRGALEAGLALAVLPWLRPEGGLTALAVVAAAELPGALRGRLVTPLALAGGPPLLSQLVLEGFRLAIYRHLLPNPALYKHVAGITFTVGQRFWAQAAPLILVAAAGAAMVRGRARLLAVPPLVYALGAVQTADIVDSFSRFFMPAWPALALLAGAAIAESAHGRGAVAIAASALLAVTGLLSGPGAVGPARMFAARYAVCGESARAAAAVWLRTRTPPATVFSISDAGLVPARAGRIAIDQLMLNEATLQDTGLLGVKKRAKWLYRRRPDIIVLVSGSPRRLKPRYPTDTAIAADPRFRAYRLAAIARAARAGCRYHLFLYENAKGRPAARSGPLTSARGRS
jgi:hypothetical protein